MILYHSNVAFAKLNNLSALQTDVMTSSLGNLYYVSYWVIVIIVLWVYYILLHAWMISCICKQLNFSSFSKVLLKKGNKECFKMYFYFERVLFCSAWYYWYRPCRLWSQRDIVLILLSHTPPGAAERSHDGHLFLTIICVCFKVHSTPMCSNNSPDDVYVYVHKWAYLCLLYGTIDLLCSSHESAV